MNLPTVCTTKQILVSNFFVSCCLCEQIGLEVDNTITFIVQGDVCEMLENNLVIEYSIHAQTYLCEIASRS